MTRMKPHKKLEVWKKGIELVRMIYKTVEKLPVREQFGLTSQIQRAAVSIPSNIAEGAGRQTRKEFINYLHIAQGSLSELDTHLEIAVAVKYLTENDLAELYVVMDDIDKMLSGLIFSLKKQLTTHNLLLTSLSGGYENAGIES